MEIIEIGSVRLDKDYRPKGDEFGVFVRPTARPILSPFCTRLTGIRQEDVDSAEPFPFVFTRFLDWIGQDPFMMCSWGAYDLTQFRVDCRRYGIEFPGTLQNHINLKKELARVRGLRPMGMKQALRYFGLQLEGRHHRALDDARNIARMAQLVLPEVVADQVSTNSSRSSVMWRNPGITVSEFIYSREVMAEWDELVLESRS